MLSYATALSSKPHVVLGPRLATVPPSGFTITDTRASEELTLSGRHRFATYELVLRVAPTDDATRLAAVTYARFPGVRGRLYRALLATIRRRVVGAPAA